MRKYLACFFVACSTLGVPDLAYACGNGAIQFVDDFKTIDPGWVFDSQHKVDGGILTLMPSINDSSSAYNSTYIFSNADVCVTVKIDEFTKPENLSGGLVFWKQDSKTLYTFSIRPSGAWQVERHLASRWILVTNGNSDAIKKSAGDLNEVEVRLSGTTGTGYINGIKTTTFNGQAPDGGGFFGLIGESETERTNIWEFRDFKILNPQ